MQRLGLIATAVILQLSIATGAASAAMIFTSIDRTVIYGSTTVSNSTTGPFSASPHVLATQDSDISSTLLSGSLSAGKDQFPVGSFSLFSVAFDLTVPHTFTFGGMSFANGAASAHLGLTPVTGSIVPQGGPISVGGLGTYLVNETGLLQPGSYSFIANGAGVVLPFAPTLGGGSLITFSFEINEAVASVPEPMSICLVCVGILSAAPIALRRRRGWLSQSSALH